MFTNEEMMVMPMRCTFGETVYPFESCGFRNDENDDFDWQPGIHDTPTQLTGPPAFYYHLQGTKLRSTYYEINPKRAVNMIGFRCVLLY